MSGIAFQEIEAKTADGRAVSLRFPPEEYAARLAFTRSELRRTGFDALLVFAQESHYYLTGFDTSGYVFFQVGVITADCRPTLLLTRRPDLRQAEVASLYDDIRIWLNSEDAEPAEVLRDILRELGLQGGRVGVEFATFGLTAANGRMLEAALDGICVLQDASDIVRRQRLVKSASELGKMRAAGKLADAAVQAAIDAAAAGATESELSAAALTSMLSRGGDLPAGGPLVNTGPRALFGRGIGGPRRIDENDQVLIELAGSYCRYHVCIESTVAIGIPDPRQHDMMRVAAEALDQIKEAARSGAALGKLDDIHRKVLDESGFATERYSACGYALGCTFKPTWMDVPPMIYSGNATVCKPGMTLFYHVMIGDSDTGYGMGVGHTLLVTESSPEALTRLPDDLTVVR